MSQFTEADSSVNRLNAAVTAFEKVLTQSEGTVVEMPIGAAQPSLAERLKRAIDAVTVKPAQAAVQASAAAQQAQAAQQSAAQSAADAASSAAATGYVDAPFPDVWAPLNDDLRLLAGIAPADTITVAGTSYPLPTKSMTFTRSTTATYIDKSGVLKTAAVNEPRFEKEGLLIEGQSTNYVLNSDDPTKWAGTASQLTRESVKDGNTQANTCKATCNTEASAAMLVQSSTITAVDGEAVALSARVKGSAGLIRFRIIKDSSNLGDVVINLVTGALVSTPPAAISSYSITVISDGYFYVTVTAISSGNGTYVGQIYALPETGVINIPVGAVYYSQMVQFEKNFAATSYIPTAASTVTRSADACTIQRSGNDNYYGQFTYSVSVHTNGRTQSSNDANMRRCIMAIYPSTTEWVLSYIEPSPGSTGKVRCTYGPGTYLQSANAVDDGAQHRVTFSTDLTQNTVAVDDTILKGITSARPTPNPTASSLYAVIYLGASSGSPGSNVRMLNGHLRDLRIWHRALSDIQIKGLR